MFNISHLKKQLLIKLMKILGFGGFAAYCIVGCSNPAPNNTEPPAQDVIKPSSDTNTVQPQNTVVEENIQEQEPVQDAALPADTAEQAINAPAEVTTISDNPPTAKPADPKELSEEELAELLKKYKPLKKGEYTTKIEKKEGFALTSTYVWVTSKTGNKIRFPETFKAIVQDSKGDYKVVFSDGTIDDLPKIPIGFFDKIPVDEDERDCDMKYACGFDRVNEKWIYDEYRKKYESTLFI